MTGRVVSGVQEPQPGSRRYKAMNRTKAWLLAHPRGGTYGDVAVGAGLTVQAVGRAATDLHLFDDDLLVSIPAPKNEYRMRAGWSEVLRRGEGNQARHAATRLERLAVRWRKIADDRDRAHDPIAGTFRIAATNAEHEARELRQISDVLG